MKSRPNRFAAVFLLSVVFFLGLAGTASAELLVINPTADSYTDTSKPTTNFGRTRTLISRYNADKNARHAVFIRFDISGIPRGSSISEATLKIYLTEMTGQKTLGVGVYRATSDWTETGIHSQNKPTGPGPITTNSIVAGKGYKSFDLTEIFTGWLGGTFPNYGVFLSTLGNKEYVAEFNSRDALASQPQLLVYYTPPSGGTDKISGMPMASGRAPLITDVTASKIKNDTATITWKTDGMTTSKVRYGKSAAYDQMISDSDQTTEHTMTIPELKPGRTYHFRVYGRNKAGLEAISADFKFFTPKVKSINDNKGANRFGWLALIGMGVGLLLLIPLGVIFVFEFPRWRRGEFKIRDVSRDFWGKLRDVLKNLRARLRG